LKGMEREKQKKGGRYGKRENEADRRKKVG
jgi:hypothetical protein